MTRSMLAVLATAAILVAACGSNTTSEPSAASPATSPAGASAAPGGTNVPAQLQFTSKTIDGQDFSGESLFGKPAVLWFWAPWCPTCQREAPMVGQVADAHPDVTFLGVAALDDLPAMQQFVDKYPVKDFKHLADTHGAVWAKFGVTTQPAYAFVGADGTVNVVPGTMSESQLTERVTALANT